MDARIAPPALASPEYRSRRRRIERNPERGPAEVRREESILISKTRSQIWQHQVQVFGRRERKPGASIATSDPRSDTSQLRFEHPEELVWRTPRRALKRDDDGGEFEVIGATGRKNTRPQQSREPELVATPAVAQWVPMQENKLDPVILDRLAENVIDRVEKRLRIERERRGL